MQGLCTYQGDKNVHRGRVSGPSCYSSAALSKLSLLSAHRNGDEAAWLRNDLTARAALLLHTHVVCTYG